uniref:TF-B3 domain-containing protein n=1 Tax=Triticum urartu TaxID=4572 RepID=A0A8R7Q037_TRIUA
MNEKVDAVHSKIPIYGTVMTNCNIFGSPYILDLSSKYADEYLPREDQTLMLQCRDKSRKVLFHINKNNTNRLFQGWREFADDNNLKVGDLCLFEPLQKKNRVMNVHIICKT